MADLKKKIELIINGLELLEGIPTDSETFIQNFPQIRQQLIEAAEDYEVKEYLWKGFVIGTVIGYILAFVAMNL